jgi:CheY-like chemotaxis protein
MVRPLHKILMVEDEPDIQSVARLALEAVGGYEVQMCGSGVTAIECAEAFAPDIILLDVMMPGMDGPTTLQNLRKLPTIAQTPVIFMTAKVQPQELATYRELGALDVISKPFDPMTLSSELRRIWDRQA